MTHSIRAIQAAPPVPRDVARTSGEPLPPQEAAALSPENARLHEEIKNELQAGRCSARKLAEYRRKSPTGFLLLLANPWSQEKIHNYFPFGGHTPAEQLQAFDTEYQKISLREAMGYVITPTTPTYIGGRPQPQNIDPIVALLTAYREKSPDDFADLVVSKDQELAYWFGDLGFRGIRYREDTDGRLHVDVFRTVSDLNAAIARHGRIRKGLPVAPVETGPLPEQMAAREQQEETEELEDGRVYTGPHWALRKERRYAAWNVVQGKIEGVIQSGPASLLGRLAGSIIGGKWEERLATIGAGLDLAFTLKAGARARNQASSANYDRPRPPSPNPPAAYREPARSAPAPTQEPAPTPDPIAKVPPSAGGEVKPGFTAKVLKPAPTAKPPEPAPAPDPIAKVPPSAGGEVKPGFTAKALKPAPTAKPPEPAPAPVQKGGRMRRPPGGGDRSVMFGTKKTSKPHKESQPIVEVLPRKTVPMKDFDPPEPGHYIRRKPPDAETQAELLARAGRTTDGRLRDANTGRALEEGEAVWGHAPDYQFKEMRDMAEKLRWTQAQFDEFFRGPTKWQIEYGPSNSSRVFDRIPRQRPVH